MEKQSGGRAKFKSLLVIESRKSVAAAASQQKPEIALQEKVKARLEGVRNGEAEEGAARWGLACCTPEAHVTRGPQTHTQQKNV